MNKTVKHIIFFIGVTLLFSSCDKYNRLQKSSDMDKKYEAAIKYFEKEDYFHASGLFEELLTAYRGTAKAEEVLFYFSMSTYNLGDYILASYHLKNFVKTYPTSKHAEECSYLSAYCYYLTSPVYSLDQSDTNRAIRELQSFMNNYPQSARMAEANKIMDELRGKLERKAYDNAKLYYNIGDYRAATTAFTNVIKDFPGCKYSEELSYLIIKSNYLLAINSIESKQEERIKSTIDAYFKFIDKFPKSTYIKNAEGYYSDALKFQQKQKNKT